MPGSRSEALQLAGKIVMEVETAAAQGIAHPHAALHGGDLYTLALAVIANARRTASQAATQRSEPVAWIPTSDLKRLPALGITILFVDKDGVIGKGSRQMFNKGEAWIADTDMDGMPQLGVTHWMPLPAAPSPDGNERP